MGHAVVLEDVFDLVKQLPARDKVRLIAWMASEIERELSQERIQPRKSLWGLWRGLDDVTEEDIAEARQEMWGSFPREDV